MLQLNMKKLLNFVIYTLLVCAGLGFVVSRVEKKNGKPGWAENHNPVGPYEEHIKRPLDFSLALMALLFLWPVILVISLMVRKKLGSPVLFTQERPGVRIRRKNAVERTVYASETQMGKTESQTNKTETVTGKTESVAEKQESVASKTKTGPNKSGSESEQIFRLFKFRTMTESLVIIGQTEESAVNTGFRKISPNHSNGGCDLYSGVVWNKTEHGKLKLIA